MKIKKFNESTEFEEIEDTACLNLLNYEST
jgi:hypothetical protein